MKLILSLILPLSFSIAHSQQKYDTVNFKQVIVVNVKRDMRFGGKMVYFKSGDEVREAARPFNDRSKLGECFLISVDLWNELLKNNYAKN